jgi:hypothetical protein
MLAEVKKLKTVNAVAEIYDDYCLPADDVQPILDRCAEIALPCLIKQKQKQNNIA